MSVFGQSHTVLFYNAENLFDTIDDPLKNDNEFLPQAEKHWNSYRYYHKLSSIYKTIAACGKWEFPAVVGLCEVENRKCLEDLCLYTPLSKAEYRIVHYESPDMRGIDVALLYNPNIVTVLSSRAITPAFSNKDIKTRDILYVRGLMDTDTVHFFVNHWPSRRGGQQASEPKRIAVAQTLKSVADSILHVNPKALILAMGDFNDQSEDKSIALLSESLVPSLPEKESAPGSLKYRQAWQTFDLFLASPELLKQKCSAHYIIANHDFLLINDQKYLGTKPFRTYAGPRYLGGYSDHLPIYIQINTQF